MSTVICYGNCILLLFLYDSSTEFDTVLRMRSAPSPIYDSPIKSDTFLRMRYVRFDTLLRMIHMMELPSFIYDLPAVLDKKVG